MSFGLQSPTSNQPSGSLSHVIEDVNAIVVARRLSRDPVNTSSSNLTQSQATLMGVIQALRRSPWQIVDIVLTFPDKSSILKGWELAGGIDSDEKCLYVKSVDVSKQNTQLNPSDFFQKNDVLLIAGVKSLLRLPLADAQSIFSSLASPAKVLVARRSSPTDENDGSGLQDAMSRFFSFVLHKSSKLLGLHITGGNETLRPIIVKSVTENSAAAGCIAAGDRIIAINGQRMVESTHELAIEAFKSSKSLDILVERVPVSESVVQQLTTTSRRSSANIRPTGPRVFAENRRHSSLSGMKSAADLTRPLKISVPFTKTGPNLGLYLVSSHGKTVVQDVVQGSINAPIQQLQKGDHIVSVNGVDVSQFDQAQVIAVLQSIQIGEDVVIDVVREPLTQLMASKPDDEAGLVGNVVRNGTVLPDKVWEETQDSFLIPEEVSNIVPDDVQHMPQESTSTPPPTPPPEPETEPQPSAEPQSETKAVTFEVQLHRSDDNPGLGFSIAYDPKRDILAIRGMRKGSIADLSGQLRVGDYIELINSQSVKGTSLEFATELLKSSPSPVVLCVQRPKP